MAGSSFFHLCFETLLPPFHQAFNHGPVHCDLRVGPSPSRPPHATNHVHPLIPPPSHSLSPVSWGSGSGKRKRPSPTSLSRLSSRVVEAPARQPIAKLTGDDLQRLGELVTAGMSGASAQKRAWHANVAPLPSRAIPCPRMSTVFSSAVSPHPPPLSPTQRRAFGVRRLAAARIPA